jgi:hypothetical protein
MTDAKFEIDADVVPIASGYRGHVLERRQVDDGQWLYGVVDTNGGVAYYVERGLKSAEGML